MQAKRRFEFGWVVNNTVADELDDDILRAVTGKMFNQGSGLGLLQNLQGITMAPPSHKRTLVDSLSTYITAYNDRLRLAQLHRHQSRTHPQAKTSPTTTRISTR